MESSLNDVTVVEGRGYKIFCDGNTVLVLKRVTMGEGVSKITKTCVTSFKDDPSRVGRIDF